MIMKFINLLVLVSILGCQPKSAPVVDNTPSVDTIIPALTPTPQEQALFDQEFQNQKQSLATQSSISPTSSGAALSSPDQSGVNPMLIGLGTVAVVATIGGAFLLTRKSGNKVAEDAGALVAGGNKTLNVVGATARGLLDPVQTLSLLPSAIDKAAPIIGDNLRKAGKVIKSANIDIGLERGVRQRFSDWFGSITSQYRDKTRGYLHQPIAGGKLELLPTLPKDKIDEFFTYQTNLREEMQGLLDRQATLAAQNKKLSLSDQIKLKSYSNIDSNIGHIKIP